MTEDDERTASPEELLRVIEEQSTATVRYLTADPRLYYLPWGAAWLVGYTAFFLHYGLGGHSYAPISQMQALAVLMAAHVPAMTIMGVGIARANRLVRGKSRSRGIMYGFAWFAGFAAMYIICGRVSSLLPQEESGLLWAGSLLAVVGILYMANGAMALNRPMFLLGIWVTAVNALGVLLGAGWHALLAAVLLGGGFIGAGLWLRRSP
ncbi:hypothetical protein [Nonomuraea jiangxiensis]|uniref:Uncharacterized protein n=1 Tax=Nonomuraea jiangxiensis TaxID=633440 RepID=A0A1G8WLI6_9ACTN|nr:hypothetical protein [Nonomuraea jiangxiensis]SDJ78956.1 hypothetical protein SAMN05421869_112202 [Nonomuraea jiangxiensis]